MKRMMDKFLALKVNNRIVKLAKKVKPEIQTPLVRMQYSYYQYKGLKTWQNGDNSFELNKAIKDE
jgi:hypothetical protein